VRPPRRVAGRRATLKPALTGAAALLLITSGHDLAALDEAAVKVAKATPCFGARSIKAEGVVRTATSVRARTRQRFADDRVSHARSRSGLFLRFSQEPDAALGLVDPVLDQAGRGDVSALIADVVSFTEGGADRFVVEQ
jgi:hypothetical protein